MTIERARNANQASIPQYTKKYNKLNNRFTKNCGDITES